MALLEYLTFPYKVGDLIEVVDGGLTLEQSSALDAGLVPTPEKFAYPGAVLLVTKVMSGADGRGGGDWYDVEFLWDNGKYRLLFWENSLPYILQCMRKASSS